MLEFTLEKERDKGKFLQELPIDILNFDKEVFVRNWLIHPS